MNTSKQETLVQNVSELDSQAYDRNNGEPLYTAEFVMNKEELLEIFPPKHENVYGDHSTNEFMPDNIDNLEDGRETEMLVIARISDDKGDAVLVENPKSNNIHPHITISCAKETAPFYSNEMIKKALVDQDPSVKIEWIDTNTPIAIKVREGWVAKQD